MYGWGVGVLRKESPPQQLGAEIREAGEREHFAVEAKGLPKSGFPPRPRPWIGGG